MSSDVNDEEPSILDIKYHCVRLVDGGLGQNNDGIMNDSSKLCTLGACVAEVIIKESRHGACADVFSYLL